MVGADGRDGVSFDDAPEWARLQLELYALPGYPVSVRMLPACQVWPDPNDRRGQLSDRALFFHPAGTPPEHFEMVAAMGNGTYLHLRDPLPCEAVCCEAGNVAHFYAASGLVAALQILAEEPQCSRS